MEEPQIIKIQGTNYYLGDNVKFDNSLFFNCFLEGLRVYKKRL